MQTARRGQGTLSTRKFELAEGRQLDLGLALSGGGMRAVVFHIGLLRRLADDDRLEHVTQVSTVSGGSLATAAILAQTGLQWPSSEQYRHQTYPALRRLHHRSGQHAGDRLGRSS
jgi:predicted acylesterase/phospholipase RssA